MKGLFLALTFLALQSEGAFSNYNSILLGDQSAGMGGAASAVVGDTSAAAFYNPATLARLNGASFSAAVGIYKKFDTVYGEEEDFTKAPLRLNQGFYILAISKLSYSGASSPPVGNQLNRIARIKWL
ncbi:MAG: hypothetical protein J0M15_16540 [Deltaproteobacteria bacterium]|jgi:long-subunit fatty acid transport protein|nr:hypothetical protein [Deltaproteobacteria bacterium]